MKLGIVVPCYNEEEVLAEASTRLLALIERLSEQNKIDKNSKIYFVDDGSKDKTWELIEGLAEKHSNISGIKLSRNRGHQNALLAGLFQAEGDALISIDADLQDDIAVMEQMVDQYHEGSKIVYGVRKRRDTDSFFKRVTAEKFYKLLHLLGVESIDNHADYRLMARETIEEFKQFREVHLFLRGLVPLLGYKSSIVYYDRAERFAGESKYPLKRMISLALNAITSFSVVPLRLVMFVGILTFLFAFGISLWALWIKVFSSEVVPGWASTVIPVYFISGIQILCLGIIAEYLGKLYQEVKQRPRYIIEKTLD